MTFLSLAEAQALHLRSLLHTYASDRLFQVAQIKFEEALAVLPDSKQTILLYADALEKQALSHKVDWDLLLLAVEKHRDAENAFHIHELIVKLTASDREKSSFQEFRLRAIQAICSCPRGIEEVVTRLEAVDFSEAEFPFSCVERLCKFGSHLKVLNLNGIFTSILKLQQLIRCEMFNCWMQLLSSVRDDYQPIAAKRSIYAYLSRCSTLFRRHKYHPHRSLLYQSHRTRTRSLQHEQFCRYDPLPLSLS